MKYTDNLNLNLPEADDWADIEKVNDNFILLDGELQGLSEAVDEVFDLVSSPMYIGGMPYLVTYGSAAALLADLPPGYNITSDFGLRIKLHTALAANATLSVGGITAAIVDSKGNGVKAGAAAGAVLTLIYNGVNFIVQGEGGGGDTVTGTAADLLAGKTLNNADGENVVGTMPNHGAISGIITGQLGAYTVPAGYHNGGGSVKADISNLTAGNVKQGVNVGGIAGTFPSDGSAVLGDVLNTKTFYAGNSAIKTGNMPNHGNAGATITTQNGTHTIPAGYHAGAGVVRATLPDLGAASGTITTQGGSVSVPAGYRGAPGSISASFANLIAGNVLSGVNIGGIVGNLQPRKYATGSVTANYEQHQYPAGLLYVYVIPALNAGFSPVMAVFSHRATSGGTLFVLATTPIIGSEYWVTATGQAYFTTIAPPGVTGNFGYSLLTSTGTAAFCFSGQVSGYTYTYHVFG